MKHFWCKESVLHCSYTVLKMYLTPETKAQTGLWFLCIVTPLIHIQASPYPIIGLKWGRCPMVFSCCPPGGCAEVTPGCCVCVCRPTQNTWSPTRSSSRRAQPRPPQPLSRSPKRRRALRETTQIPPGRWAALLARWRNCSPSWCHPGHLQGGTPECFLEALNFLFVVFLCFFPPRSSEGGWLKQAFHTNTF